MLWLSRCSHCCVGCFQPESWKNSGLPVTEEFVKQLLKDLDKPYITGLTITGGDPLHKANYEEVIKLCQLIKKELPEKGIWLWTGYTLSQIKNDLLRFTILETIDVLIDGKYEKDKPTKKPFRGSSNQSRYKLLKGVPYFID